MYQSEFPLDSMKPIRTPSKYQSAIYEWIKNGTGHAVVEAVAGSGKTTTMLDSLLLARGRVLFTAFNQSIAAELKRRAPSHVTVSTLHSLGLQTLKAKCRSIVVDVDGKKVEGIVKAVFPDVPVGSLPEDVRAAKGLQRMAERAISLAKATLVPLDSEDAILEMMEHFEIDSEDVPDRAPVIEALPEMMASCSRDTWMADFDDMIWMPVALGLEVEPFDWVFVDEAQDMNRCQTELIMRAVHPGTRVVAVGDRRQSIYGFRGADTEAIPAIIERLKAETFPLSITYRCPVSHVALVQSIVPEIEARPEAPEGLIKSISLGDAVKMMTPFDLALCRVNAPLMKVAMALMKQGKKATVKGRDIGAGITTLIRKAGGRRWATMSMEELLERLEVYYRKESKKLKAKGKSPFALCDKIEAVMALSDDFESPVELSRTIESIFQDKAPGVTLSSVHRAKGLEAERVFVLAPDLMPHPMARATWEVEQEENIKYVALTRSKSEMYFVDVPKTILFEEVRRVAEDSDLS